MIAHEIGVHLLYPLVVICLSTISSWIVFTQVWTPYQERREVKQHLSIYRTEALARLAALEMACNKKWSNNRMLDFLYGNVSVNHTLKEWKISYLVHSGWSDSVYEQAISTLTELENLAQEDQKLPIEERTKKSKQLLDSLLLFLKNQKEL